MTNRANPLHLRTNEAIAYTLAREPLVTHTWLDCFGEKHVRYFTVCGIANRDVLETMRNAIVAALEGTLSRAHWLRDMTLLLKQAGYWGPVNITGPNGEVQNYVFDKERLTRIFNVNTRMAYVAGLWQRVWRNRRTHPYILYMTLGDARVKPQHRAWCGICLPVEHSFWQTHWPPNGLRCRCSVRSLSQGEYGQFIKNGIPFRTAEGELIHIPLRTEAPAINRSNWRNPRTGEIEHITSGIAPGFDFNSGIVFMALQDSPEK